MNIAGADSDTIAAIATPPGRGAIGIVRVSGPAAHAVLERVTRRTAAERSAELRTFYDPEGRVIDRGIVLRFVAPRSFTGEDVVELQGHGGPVVMDLLLSSALAAGARMARPGEFSERAFLNGRIDLAQAEAVADLIDSASRAAARSAARSLSGEFSTRIAALAERLLDLRVFIEAAIDFPEDEVDFLAEGDVLAQLQTLAADLDALMGVARQGALLTEGIRLVLAGVPNVGKSSLLNRLAGYERAIVTNIPGTTRDTLSEQINLDGIPLTLIDTAGLRDARDSIEQEGMRRTQAELADADRILWVCDARDRQSWNVPPTLPNDRLTIVWNKTDLCPDAKPLAAGAPEGSDPFGTVSATHVRVSALTGEGIDELKAHLKALVGFRDGEGVFSARRRHLDALGRTRAHVHHGMEQLQQSAAGELVAEDLRHAHDVLGEIVGRVTPDALLGAIFSRFCIGK